MSCEDGMCWAEPLSEACDHWKREATIARADRDAWQARAEDTANSKLRAEIERLQASLLTVVDQVESCCSRSGLCIDVDRVRAEAQRPMDDPKRRIEPLPDSIWNFENGSRESQP